MADVRRTKIQIYVDILRSIQRKNGRLKKTHIVYRANLTHSRLENYLKILLVNHFLIEEKIEKQIYYKITEKGLQFLQQVNKMKELSDTFGITFY